MTLTSMGGRSDRCRLAVTVDEVGCTGGNDAKATITYGATLPGLVSPSRFAVDYGVTWGACSDERKPVRSDRSEVFKATYASRDDFASPTCHTMASSKVTARPSWRWGAVSAMPHSGAVRHSRCISSQVPPYHERPSDLSAKSLRENLGSGGLGYASATEKPVA